MDFTLTGTLTGKTASYSMSGKLICTMTYDFPDGVDPADFVGGAHAGGPHNSYSVTSGGATIDSFTQTYDFEYSISLEPLSGTSYTSHGLGLDAVLFQTSGISPSFITGYSVTFIPTSLNVTVT
jgi:hypothetical protein